MLRKLFRGRSGFDSADPAERVKALAGANPAPDAAILRTLVTGDPDPAVRAAALARLERSEDLAPLLDAVVVAAEVAATLAARADLPATVASHPLVLAARLDAANPASALAAAGAGVPDEALCQALLTLNEGRRRALLPALTHRGETALGTLEKLSRNRCKTTNRWARDRLAEVRQLRDEADTADQRARELLAALDRDHEGLGRREVLLREAERLLAEMAGQDGRLAAFGAATADRAAALAAACDRTRHALAEAQPPEPVAPVAPAEPVAQSQSAAANPPAAVGVDTVAERAAIDAALGALVAALGQGDLEAALTARSTVDTLRGSPAFPEFAATAVGLEARVAELSTACTQLARLPRIEVPALPEPWPREPDALRALWREAAGATRRLHEARRTLAAVHWPRDVPPPPAMTTCASDADALAVWLGSVEAHRKTALDEIEKAIAATIRHLDGGELRAARSSFGLARRLDRSLGEHPHEKALARAAARLGELVDWSKFATAPKREALIESIEALVREPLAAPDQAHAIKRARADWTALGPVGHDERALDERFNALAEQAFEPCREFFKQQADQRAHNLAARQRICEQLEHYLAGADWQHPDLRAADRILRTAREEWLAHHPVERNEGKPLAARFDALQQRLSDRLRELRLGHEERKRALIAQARALAEGDQDSYEKAEGIKTLQQQWKEVGPTLHRLDQELWLEFRAECDRIFGTRDAARAADQDAREAAAAEAERLIAQFEQRVEAGDGDRAAFDELRAKLTALGELPRARERPLRERMSVLAEELHSAASRAAARQRLAQLDELCDADRAVSMALANRDALATDGSPTGPEPLFAARFAPSSAGGVSLLRLAVRAEVLAGLDSPAADQAMRLAIQVEELNRSLNRGTGTDDAVELAEQWCASPGEDGREPLRERLFAALRVLETRDQGRV